MSEPQNLRAMGERIEQGLDELSAGADPRVANLAEELLRLVSDLYGVGFSRVLEIVQRDAPELMDALVRDDFVASLLLVLGLHPDALDQRVEEALVGVRPFLAQHGGDVELLAIDDEVGAVKLRLLGNCDGCPSSASTLQGAVEHAILAMAPEIVRIDVEPSSPTPATSVTLGVKPVFDECPAQVSA
jgi:Fe-S cluster biogenesis protein NfuA